MTDSLIAIIWFFKTIGMKRLSNERYCGMQLNQWEPMCQRYPLSNGNIDIDRKNAFSVSR